MFRDRIQDKYEDLSPRFRSLADFILENTLDVGFVTATELARRVGVDPATVVRFSQEIGYSGFRELSREIKKYINEQLALRYKKGPSEEEGLTGQILTLTNELSDRILDMKADAAMIAEAVEKIAAAKRVFVISTAEGYGLASLWATYLGMLNIKSYFVQATLARSAILLQEIKEDDVLIAIALGLGPDTEIGYVLNAAQEREIHTVSITTNPSLLPAREASQNLVVHAKTPSGYPFFDTLTALLSLLWQGLVVVNPEATQMGVKNTLDTLGQLVEQKDQVPPYDTAALLRFWGQEEE